MRNFILTVDTAIRDSPMQFYNTGKIGQIKCQIYYYNFKNDIITGAKPEGLPTAKCLNNVKINHNRVGNARYHRMVSRFVYCISVGHSDICRTSVYVSVCAQTFFTKKVVELQTFESMACFQAYKILPGFNSKRKNLIFISFL